jgi:hypothetical protein
MKKAKKSGMKAAIDALISAAGEDSFSHPLFDSSYYNEQLPQFARTTEHAMVHFLTVGEQLGLRPHPIFDRKFVLEQARENGVDTEKEFSPFVYVMQQDISPNRLFSKDIYRKSLRDSGMKCAKNQTHIEHFLIHWVHNRVPFSLYFDVKFYELNNPHLVKSGTNPLEHYFRVPRRERADANPMFHAGYYANAYACWETDPLIDFLAKGSSLLNLPNPYAAQELLSEAFVTPENLLNYIETRTV